MRKDNKTGKAAIQEGAGSINDFDFRHHLHDTIILLGGKKEIADLLDRSQDYRIRASDINDLRRYNGGLIDQTKDRLANIQKVRIKPKSK